jgi:hypothetical protein
LGEVIQRRFRRNHLVKILPEFLGPIPPKRQSRKGFTGLPIAPPASLIVALVTLNALRPGLLPGFGMPILVFSIAVLGAYLMTLSQVEYLRWRGRGIGLQALGSITNYWIGKGWGNY